MSTDEESKSPLLKEEIKQEGVNAPDESTPLFTNARTGAPPLVTSIAASSRWPHVVRLTPESPNGRELEKDEIVDEMGFMLTPPPNRIRFDPLWLLYLGVALECLFSVTTGCLILILPEEEYATYHLFAAFPRVCIWLWIGFRFSEDSGLDSRLCCNSYLFSLDTLSLMGGLSSITFGAMQVNNIIEHDTAAENTAFLIPVYAVSVVTNCLVVMSENFMFRCITLVYDFSKKEYMAFKTMQLLICFIVMSLGVCHTLNGPKRAAHVLYLFTLLIWRREMFASLSRIDSSNKFTGIVSGYALYGAKGWYGD